MTSLEKKPDLKNSSARTLLAGLALLGSFALTPQRVDAAPVDGIRVCVVKGSPKPTIFNPNPLEYCPPYGENVRMSSGKETVNYMNTYYPNGLTKSWILDTIIRLSR